jgi:hypothetical protein
MTTTTDHKIRWFVYAGGFGAPLVKIPHTSTMRGTWAGYDVECSCGWESRTGGAVRSYIKREIWAHKNGFGA